MWADLIRAKSNTAVLILRRGDGVGPDFGDGHRFGNGDGDGYGDGNGNGDGDGGGISDDPLEGLCLMFNPTPDDFRAIVIYAQVMRHVD